MESLPAVAHKLLEDDEYDGYEIPGGSVIIGNAWSVSSALTLLTLELIGTQGNFARRRKISGSGGLLPSTFSNCRRQAEQIRP